MSGILIIPLWKNAKFWTFAFRDGIHLNAMFQSVQIVRMHTLGLGIPEEGYNWRKRDPIFSHKDWIRQRATGVGITTWKR
jgi:hypothetical protein